MYKRQLLKAPVDLPRAKGELEVERILGKMAGKNTAASAVPFFVGAGAYKHHVPATVDHPVSYTHLDVYKRQVLAADERALAVIDAFALGLEPVSYTHLDVYKRQA